MYPNGVDCGAWDQDEREERGPEAHLGHQRPQRQDQVPLDDELRAERRVGDVPRSRTFAYGFRLYLVSIRHV